MIRLLGRLYDRFLYDPMLVRYGWEPRVFDRPDREWFDARTLGELGECTALWLEGRIARQPAYGGPVDVDDDIAPGLKDTLIACNRGGFVSVQSQAGIYPYDPCLADFAVETGSRAAVVGLTDPDTARLIVEAMPEPIQAAVWDGAPRWGWQATRAYEQTGCVFGPEDVGNLRMWFNGCPETAVAEALAACQVSIWDPESGPNDLWPALAEVFGGPS